MDLPSAYREHREPLLRYLYRLTGDPARAEDLAEETFLRLAQNPGPKENLRAWLYTVARNLVVERAWTRNTRDRLHPPGDPTRSPPRRPDEAFEARRAIDRLREALSELAPRDQQVLLMRQEGFTHREIAEAIGVRTSSVGTIVARALRRLRATLDEAEGEAGDGGPGALGEAEATTGD